MDKTNIRFYIFTRFKLGVNAKQIYKELCDTWGEGCVSYTTLAEWIQRFNQGRTSFEDHPRSGRPVTEATDRSIEVIRALFRWKYIDQLFLIPITMWTMIESAFLVAQFTRVRKDF